MAGLEEAVVIHMKVYPYLGSLFLEGCILIHGKDCSYEEIVMILESLWKSKTVDAKSYEEKNATNFILSQ